MAVHSESRIWLLIFNMQLIYLPSIFPFFFLTPCKCLESVASFCKELSRFATCSGRNYVLSVVLNMLPLSSLDAPTLAWMRCWTVIPSPSFQNSVHFCQIPPSNYFPRLDSPNFLYYCFYGQLLHSLVSSFWIFPLLIYSFWDERTSSLHNIQGWSATTIWCRWLCPLFSLGLRCSDLLDIPFKGF